MRHMLTAAAMLTLAAGCFTLGGCTTAPSSDSGKMVIKDEAASALARAQQSDSTISTMISNAKGYAVFPRVGKGAVGVGGAYGHGVLYEGGKQVGYCDLSQGSIGFQLGGQAYTELVLFENDKSLSDFKNGHLEFDAQATAVALKSGSGANAKYQRGVAVFTMGEEGLMYEASLGGQRFTYQPF